MTPESQLLTGLASNGPWALVAGFLLWKVIDAWTQDRKQLAEVIKVMAEFKNSIDNLAKMIEKVVTWDDEVGGHARVRGK